MKVVDTEETVLIVTGSEIDAEMNDRPVAYELKTEIDRLGGGKGFRRAVVVSDHWYAQNRIFHLCPTVTIGGPGVNRIAAALLRELPMIVQQGERVFIQGAWDGESKRASLWGADRAATAEAVQQFVGEGLCAKFLERVWKN